MEPPWQGPAADKSQTSLEGMGNVGSCKSWCLNVKRKKPGPEVPSFLVSLQSADSYWRKFTWKVLEARISGLRSFYTTDINSLEVKFIQLNSGEVACPDLASWAWRISGLSDYRNSICLSHVHGLFSLWFILMTFMQRGANCELPLINGLSSPLTFSQHPLASPGV